MPLMQSHGPSPLILTIKSAGGQTTGVSPSQITQQSGQPLPLELDELLLLLDELLLQHEPDEQFMSMIFWSGMNQPIQYVVAMRPWQARNRCVA